MYKNLQISMYIDYSTCSPGFPLTFYEENAAEFTQEPALYFQKLPCYD